MQTTNDTTDDNDGLTSEETRVPARSISVWTGAAAGLACAAVLVWAVAELPTLLASFQLTALLLTLITLVIVAGVSFLVSRLLGRLGMSAAYTWAVLAAALLFVSFGAGPSLRGWVLTFVLMVLAASVLGAVVASLANRSWKRRDTTQRAIVVTRSIGCGLVLVIGAVWLLTAGPSAPSTIDVMRLNDPPSDDAGVPDPAAEGDHSVRQLTYGSGSDRHRGEYGEEVTIPTDSVDASAFLSGWEGITDWSRTRYWGFDETALPVNGRVWYPEGDGPFPLVLLVHGRQPRRPVL